MAKVATIQFYRGAAAGIPTLEDGEPGWATDTHVLYIGQGGVNYPITGGTSYTDEQARDAVAAMFLDSATIDFTTADETGTGSTGYVTASVIDGSITYAKMQDVSAGSVLLGRGDSGSGDVQEITLGTGLSMSGTTLSATYSDEAAQDAVGRILTDSSTIDFRFTDDTGTGSTGFITADVIDNSISDAKLRDSAALSVIGRSANSSGDPADIAAGTDNQVLRRSGTSLAFGAVNLASSDAVTGVLDETNGGTGQNTITTGDILYGSASNTLSTLALGSAGTWLGNGGGGLPAWTAVTQAAQGWSWTGGVSDSITADQNNYNPAGLSTAAVLRVVPDTTPRSITGLAGGASGRLMLVFNLGSSALTLVDDSGSSSAANRFALSSDLAIPVGDGLALVYDSTTSRWRTLVAAPTGSAGGDLTGTYPGPSVAAGAVTYAKMQDVSAASRLLGRGSAAGSGDPEEISLGAGLSMSGTTLSCSITQYSDEMAQDAVGRTLTDSSTIDFRFTDDTGTGSTGFITADVIDASITYAKMQAASAASVLLGRGSASAGAVQEITLGSGLSMSGTTLSATGVTYTDEQARDAVAAMFLDTATIDFTTADDSGTGSTGYIKASVIDGSISDSKLRDSAALSVIGRSANSTGDPADIAAGTDNQVLRRSGTSLAFGAVNLASSDAVTGVLDETNGGTGQSTITAGDILYGSASNTLSKLAAGTNGHVLTLASGVPSWALAGLTYLSTASASGSASLDFTLPSGYVAFLLVFNHLAPATDNVELRLRTSTDGGSTYDAGGTDYRWTTAFSTDGGTGGNQGSTGASQIRLHNGLGNAANRTASGWVFLHSPSAAKYFTADGITTGVDTSGNLVVRFASGQRVTAADVDAVRLIMSSGNIASGDAYLYGIRGA